MVGLNARFAAGQEKRFNARRKLLIMADCNA